MKKYIAIVLMLAAALTFSACGDTQKENNTGTPSETTTENAPNNNNADTDGDSSKDNSEKSPPDEDIQALIEQFDVDSFTAPDGTEVKLTDAVSAVDNLALYFDFAYIRYAEPLYKDTVSNPEIYDFEKYEFTEDLQELEQKPFKAVKGDVLDNGMKVVNAYYALLHGDTMHPLENGVELEGECTLEGVLFHVAEDDYMLFKDEVLFYPNPTTGTVPTTYNPYFAFALSMVDLDSEFAFISDGGSINLGNMNDIDVDVSKLFEDSSYVKVKVTLDGMHIRYSENFGSQCWSRLKSAEKLD